MSLNIYARSLFLLLGFCGGLPSQAAQTIEGAGATSMLPLVKYDDAQHPNPSGITVNYQPVGSGKGIEKLVQNKLDFAASDVPLPLKELEANHLMQFPLIGSGVVVVVHIDGVPATQLKLDRAELAGIFLGTITNWNDPDIAEDNPGLKLPNKKITVVHRGDLSGTTYAFTSYLSEVRPEWGKAVGAGFNVAWKTGVEVTGNQGVADAVSRTSGSIGYVSYDYAIQNKLQCIQLLNRENRFVSPNRESLTEGLSHMAWDMQHKFSNLKTNPAGKGSWPISTAMFIILPVRPEGDEVKKEVFQYFSWLLGESKQISDSFSFVPLPDVMQAYVKVLLKTK